MTKFILLASRRSGTSFVIDCLNSHPQIHCVKRAFGLEKKIKNPTADEHSGGFYLYRMKSLSNRIGYYFSRDALIDGFINADIYAENKAKGSIGFRLIYEMSQKYPGVSRWATRNKVKVIHLVRENILKTYVSHVSAKAHKMRHPKAGDKIKTAKVHLDPEKTVEELNRRLELIERQRSMFRDCATLEITYEDFVANKKDVSVSILDFLEVDNTLELKSDLVKINPDTLEDVIDNFDEIKNILSGTSLEKYIY